MGHQQIGDHAGGYKPGGSPSGRTRQKRHWQVQDLGQPREGIGGHRRHCPTDHKLTGHAHVDRPSLEGHRRGSGGEDQRRATLDGDHDATRLCKSLSEEEGVDLDVVLTDPEHRNAAHEHAQKHKEQQLPQVAPQLL